MRTCSPYRYRITGLLLGAFLSLGAPSRGYTQAAGVPAPVLLSRARTLEERGRLDLAEGDWTQVLQVDPKNIEALAGMVRALRAEGRTAEEQTYLSRLRALNPKDPNVLRVESSTPPNADRTAQLAEAARLARAGESTRAMAIYRGLYGSNPPAGETALVYYETEATTEEGRPHAVAGLRALADRYPGEPRYQIALGRALTSNPRTRAEGRKLLERYPDDPDAVNALRPTVAEVGSAPAQGHVEAVGRSVTNPAGAVHHPLTLTGEQIEARARERARTADEEAAYAALAAGHAPEAEQRFRILLARDPEDKQASAGLAQLVAAGTLATRGARGPGGKAATGSGGRRVVSRPPIMVTAALADAPNSAVVRGTEALRRGDLPGAEGSFRAVLAGHPDDPAALGGLGEALLEAQQSEAAVSVYTQYTQTRPADPAGWLGLLRAQASAGRYREVLQTEGQLPTAVRSAVQGSPDFYRSLAAAERGTGNYQEAERTLGEGLDLPFPDGGHGLPADGQVPYADLLRAAGRQDEAAGLFRRIVTADPNNTAAWIGLVKTQHALRRDPEALSTIGHMPSRRYAAAFAEPDFVAIVAAVNESEGHPEVAQALLESLLTRQRSTNQVLYAPAEIQLAGLTLRRGDAVRANALYRAALAQDPNDPEAWAGMVAALHGNGQDADALAQLIQIPATAQRSLAHDLTYLRAVGSLYRAQGQPAAAAYFLALAQAEYVDRGAQPPVALEADLASLLLAQGDHPDLYRVLLYLGGRTDATDAQRAAVQLLWVRWAVRRANAEAAGGDQRGAVATLGTAMRSFSANAEALQLLADGYTSIGLPSQAEAMFRTFDLSKASSAVCASAINAALTAGDRKQTESWLREAQARFPADGELQLLAGREEQARGHAKRAAELYRAALQAPPSTGPGVALAAALRAPDPEAKEYAVPQRTPGVPLLLGALDPVQPVATAPSAHPYLPSYAEVQKGIATGDLGKPPSLPVGTCGGWAGCATVSVPATSPAPPSTLPSRGAAVASSHGPTLRQFTP